MSEIVKRVVEQRREYVETESVRFGSVSVELPPPTRIPETPLVERGKVIDKALAAWTPHGNRPPLNFRLVGPPGVGKNAIVYELARILRRDLYIISGHNELTAEDIACTVRPTRDNRFKYVASPLLAGMHRGGIVFFDEIGKATASALDPLTSVVDDRRALYSVLAGIQVYAHPEFLFCAALQDSEAHALPTFIDERTCPAIHMGYPSVAEIERILNAHFPDSSRVWTDALIAVIGREDLSARKALTLMGYAYRTTRHRGLDPAALSLQHVRELMRELARDIGLSVAPAGRGSPATKTPTNGATTAELSGDDDFQTAFSVDGDTVH